MTVLLLRLTIWTLCPMCVPANRAFPYGYDTRASIAALRLLCVKRARTAALGAGVGELPIDSRDPKLLVSKFVGPSSHRFAMWEVNHACIWQ